MTKELIERVARAIFAVEFPEVDGVSWADLSPEAEQEHYRDLARAALAAHQEHWDIVVWGVRSDGFHALKADENRQRIDAAIRGDG